jgi:hypothetical protein
MDDGIAEQEQVLVFILQKLRRRRDIGQQREICVL